MKNYFLLLSTLIFGLLMTSCDPDEPDDINEEELITTVIYTLTPDGGGTPIVLSYKDLDGDGSGAPVIEGGTLSANQTYAGSLNLLNETETPAESITAEIDEEDDEHQFFFQTDIVGLSVAYNDAQTLVI